MGIFKPAEPHSPWNARYLIKVTIVSSAKVLAGACVN